MIPRATTNALQLKKTKIFQMLLNVEGGSKKQKHWANAAVGDITMLHCATLSRSFAALHMLLSAGADSTDETVKGNTARDLVDCVLPGHAVQDEDKEGAIQEALLRLLERAPACRARSWA